MLPWEDPAEYGAILNALREEHAPQGPTEEHLVEELAGIVWRKRRLRLAEAAAHRKGLYNTMEVFSRTTEVALAHLHGGHATQDVGDAIREMPADTAAAIRELEADEAKTRRAVDLLGSPRSDRYEAALSALREDTRTWWENTLQSGRDEFDEGEVPYEDDPDHLRRFIETQVLPWYRRRRTELTNRPLIREQAFGEALDAGKLEVLARYEVHLDRKLERMLTMLVRLKDLRQGKRAIPPSD